MLYCRRLRSSQTAPYMWYPILISKSQQTQTRTAVDLPVAPPALPSQQPLPIFYMIGTRWFHSWTDGDSLCAGGQRDRGAFWVQRRLRQHWRRRSSDSWEAACRGRFQGLFLAGSLHIPHTQSRWTRVPLHGQRHLRKSVVIASSFYFLIFGFIIIFVLLFGWSGPGARVLCVDFLWLWLCLVARV